MKLDPRTTNWTQERFLYEEQLGATHALERRMRKARRTPDARLAPFAWLRTVLIYAVGVMIGANVGVIAVLACFFIFVKVLHINLTF